MGRRVAWVLRACGRVALAAIVAHGLVAVALAAPLSHVDRAVPVDHHGPDDRPTPPGPDHFECCGAQTAPSGTFAAPVPLLSRPRAASRPRRLVRVAPPPRPRPWRASLGRHPPRRHDPILAL